MRYLKLSAVAIIAALAVIGLLRITDQIDPDQATWLVERAFIAVAILAVAAFGLGVLSRRPSTTTESSDRPIP